MVDWETVEKRRSKGWDWDRIAQDPKVDFHADASAGEPGRALRALYYQRRSKTKRRSAGSGEEGGGDGPEPLAKRWSLARIGYLSTPLFGIWFLLAFVFPSPVGTFLPAVPVLGILLAIGAFVLAFGLLRATDRWNTTLRSTLIVGLILGLVIAGAFAGAAKLAGCPTLASSASLSSEPAGWAKAANPSWQSNGAPIFFFYGSAACPFCSASSWAMTYALQKFGTLSGTYYDHSSPTDTYPNTPEVVLANAGLTSQYAALDIVESTYDLSIQIPATPSCVEQAYLSAYDTGGSIPFVVINGQYVHVGSLVDPAPLQGLSATQVQGQLQNQSGAAWTAISPQAYYIMAFLVKTDGGLPTSVASIPQVQSDLAQIH